MPQSDSPRYCSLVQGHLKQQSQAATARSSASAAATAVMAISVATAISLLAPVRVQAHGIQSTVTPLASLRDELVLTSAFSSGEPTRDALVSLVPPGGAPIALGRTNAQGQVSFRLPKDANGDWELEVDGGPGHRDYLEMPVHQGQAALDRISDGHDHGLSDALAEAGLPGSLLVGGLGLGGVAAAAVLIRQSRPRRRS